MGKAAVIRQQSRVQHQQMLVQDEEVARRRNLRMKKKAEKLAPKESGKKRTTLFYMPTIILVSAGVAMTLGSTIRGLGEGTIFWEMKEDFHLVGPIVLSAGILLLLITVGILTSRDSKHNKDGKTLGNMVSPPISRDFKIPPRSRNVHTTSDKSSIPIMAFEEEEFYVKHVKTKPREFQEVFGKSKSNNNYVLTVEPSANNKNSDMDITWPDSFRRKYQIDETKATSSLPLLADTTLESTTDSLQSLEDSSLELSAEDLSNLPESFI